MFFEWLFGLMKKVVRKDLQKNFSSSTTRVSQFLMKADLVNLFLVQCFSPTYERPSEQFLFPVILGDDFKIFKLPTPCVPLPHGLEVELLNILLLYSFDDFCAIYQPSPLDFEYQEGAEDFLRKRLLVEIYRPYHQSGHHVSLYFLTAVL